MGSSEFFFNFKYYRDQIELSYSIVKKINTLRLLKRNIT